MQIRMTRPLKLNPSATTERQHVTQLVNRKRSRRQQRHRRQTPNQRPTISTHHDQREP